MRLERVQQLTMRSSRECQAPLKLCNLYIMHLREMHYDMDNNAFAVECTKQLFFIAIQYQNKSLLCWIGNVGVREKCGLVQGPVCSIYDCTCMARQSNGHVVQTRLPAPGLFWDPQWPPGGSSPSGPLAQGNPQKHLNLQTINNKIFARLSSLSRQLIHFYNIC